MGSYEKGEKKSFSDYYRFVVKSRRIRWAGNVARMGERRGIYRVLVGNLRERDHVGDPGVDGRIILRWIIRKWDVEVWTGSSWLRIGTGSGTCECGNEPSGNFLISCRPG
jgi:hypothetical protein